MRRLKSLAQLRITGERKFESGTPTMHLTRAAPATRTGPIDTAVGKKRARSVLSAKPVTPDSGVDSSTRNAMVKRSRSSAGGSDNHHPAPVMTQRSLSTPFVSIATSSRSHGAGNAGVGDDGTSDTDLSSTLSPRGLTILHSPLSAPHPSSQTERKATAVVTSLASKHAIVLPGRIRGRASTSDPLKKMNTSCTRQWLQENKLFCESKGARRRKAEADKLEKKAKVAKTKQIKRAQGRKRKVNDAEEEEEEEEESEDDRRKVEEGIRAMTKKVEKRQRPNILFMDGGTAYVPPERYHEFLAQISLDWLVGNAIYLTEVEPDDEIHLTILQFDFDLSMLNGPLTPEQEDEWFQLLFSMVKVFWPGGGWHGIQVKRKETREFFTPDPARPNPPCGSLCYSNGLHFIFSGISRRGSQFRKLVAALWMVFEAKYGIPTWNLKPSWRDIIDKMESGLRPPFSRKAIPCGLCGSKKNRDYNCPECAGSGKIDIGRVYVPSHHWGDDGVRHPIARDGYEPYKVLLRATLRDVMQNERSDWRANPAGTPPAYNPREEKLEQARKAHSRSESKRPFSSSSSSHVAGAAAAAAGGSAKRKWSGGSGENKEGSGGSITKRARKPKWGGDVAPVKGWTVLHEEGTPVYEELTRWMRQVLPVAYEDMEILQVRANRSYTEYRVTVDSRFCLNLEDGRHGEIGEHQGNHVWFWLNGQKKTLHQRCFCTCETTIRRRGGREMCKDFTFPGIGIPTPLHNLLFGKRARVTKKQKERIDADAAKLASFSAAVAAAAEAGSSVSSTPSSSSERRVSIDGDEDGDENDGPNLRHEERSAESYLRGLAGDGDGNDNGNARPTTTSGISSGRTTSGGNIRGSATGARVVVVARQAIFDPKKVEAIKARDGGASSALNFAVHGYEWSTKHLRCLPGVKCLPRRRSRALE